MSERKEFKGRQEDVENGLYENKYAGKFLDFLNEYYPNASITTLESYFSSYKSYVLDFEKVKNKHLYNFNESDILEIFNSITTSSNRTPQQLKSLLTKYFEWAFMRQYNASGINPMSIVDIDKIKKNNTKLTKDRYISKKDLIKICIRLNESGLASPQETIILLLARYGIVKNTMEDITNLLESDIDMDNNIIIINNEEEPYIVEFDEDFKNELKKAINCYEYKDSREKVRNYSEMSKYVIKVNTGNTAATSSVIRNRLFSLNKNCSRKLTLTDMEICCKIDRLKELKEEKKDGRLHTEDFRRVQIEFGKSYGSYKGLQDDYMIITGDEDIDNSKCKEVYRVIDGKWVTASDLGMTESEFEEKYPLGNTTKGRRIRYLKSKEYNSNKEIWNKED